MPRGRFNRRDLISGLAVAASVWPLAVRAQQSGRVRRIGVLMGLTQSDPEGQSRIATFRKALQDLGWTEGRDLRTDYYWGAGDVDRTHALAKELVSSAPDVIVVNTPPGLSALRLETHTIPIIFVQVLDASESTVVMNPARPESNVTGFTNSYEYGVSGKWLALLKEIAPSVSRVAILQNPNHPSWVGYQGSIAKPPPFWACSRSQHASIRRPTLIVSSMLWHANLMAACSSFRTHSPRFIATKSWLWPTIIACLRYTRCGSLPLAED
jgi:putative tryptophan/tyrosine transport system substrate-binding protein